MTVSHTQKHTQSATADDSITQVISVSHTYTSGARADIAEAIPGSATTNVNWAVPYARVKAISILADGALTLKTNSSGSPDDTITLAAGKPYQWDTDQNAAFLIAHNVTSLYVVNAGADPVNLQILCLYDPTA